jgi:hypothetical protein
MWGNGNIATATLKNGKTTEVKEYKLQKDHTHTLFHVKFDADGNEIERKEVSKGHKSPV